MGGLMEENTKDEIFFSLFLLELTLPGPKKKEKEKEISGFNDFILFSFIHLSSII